MATIFNESEIAAEPAQRGAARQHLLTDARVPGTRILLDRLTLAPGGEARLAVPAQGLAWFQMLQGEAVLAHDGERQALTDAHVAFLPPSYAATISSSRGAVLLYGEIPDAASLDPASQKIRPASAWWTGRASRCSIPSTMRWCRRRDLNPRPPAYEADALPLSYAGERMIPKSGNRFSDKIMRRY